VHVVGQADRLEAVLSLSDEGEPLGTAKYRARSEAEWGLVIDDDDGKFGVRHVSSISWLDATKR
jgi:hypothetical protein